MFVHQESEPPAHPGGRAARARHPGPWWVEVRPDALRDRDRGAGSRSRSSIGPTASTRSGCASSSATTRRSSSTCREASTARSPRWRCSGTRRRRGSARALGGRRSRAPGPSCRRSRSTRRPAGSRMRLPSSAEGPARATGSWIAPLARSPASSRPATWPRAIASASSSIARSGWSPGFSGATGPGLPTCPWIQRIPRRGTATRSRTPRSPRCSRPPPCADACPRAGGRRSTSRPSGTPHRPSSRFRICRLTPPPTSCTPRARPVAPRGSSSPTAT